MIILSAYLFIGLFPFLLLPGSVRAEGTENIISSCQPIYGGGETCIQTENIAINKTVQDPQTLQYVDNLGANDPKYAPGQTVQFRIAVKNTSNVSVKNIKVEDRLPQYMDDPKIINFNIDNLNPNETKTLISRGKIASKNSLPDDNKTICLINQAIAAQNQQISQDNSQFCIQKNEAPSATGNPVNPISTKGGLSVYPPSDAKATPATGPETVALFGLFASCLFGLMLRKKSIKR